MTTRVVFLNLKRDSDVSKTDKTYDNVIDAAILNYVRDLPKKADVQLSDVGEGQKYLGLREVAGVQYAVTDADRLYLESLEYLKTFQAAN